MELRAPDLSAQASSAIERAIRAPADKPIEMQGLVTTDLPAAADYPYGWIFDITAGVPKFSSGANWLTFSASVVTNTPAGNISATTVQAAINELDTEKGGLALANVWTNANTISQILLNVIGANHIQLLQGASSRGYIYADSVNCFQSKDGGGTVQFSISQAGLVTLASGQIKFPATQNASSDANTLDDYEEGTFTPVLTFGGGSTSITYSRQQGRYTKIGRLVFVEVNITLTSKGSSTGVAEVSMPFTCAGFPEHGGCVISANNMISVVVPFATMNASSSVASIRDIVSSSLSNLTNSNFQNTTTLRISITYTV